MQSSVSGAECSSAGPSACGTHHFVQSRTQAHDRQRMNLRHSGFSDAEHRSHLPHGEFLEIVESEHLLFLLRQFSNYPGQKVFHLRAQAAEKRRVFGSIWKVIAQVFFFSVPRRLDAQTSDLQAVQLAEQVLKILKSHAHLGGHLVLGGGTAQLEAQLAVRLLDLSRLAPQLARSPVHFAQAVEDGAADAKLGIGAELHVLGTVELVESIDESDHSRVHEIFEGHMARQPFVDAARKVADLRQLFEQDAVPLFLVLPGGVGLRGILAHSILTSPSTFDLCGCDLAGAHRRTPTDCTSTTGGTSIGESTTTFGRKGSSSRFRW